MTDKSEIQERSLTKVDEKNNYIKYIIKTFKRYNLFSIESNRNWDTLRLVYLVIILSYLLSLFSFCLFHKSALIILYLVSFFDFCPLCKATWSWWLLLLGLMINYIASDMISISKGKLAQPEIFSDLNIDISDEIKYGNEISRIGFACQAIGLVFSLFNS